MRLRRATALLLLALAALCGACRDGSPARGDLLHVEPGGGGVTVGVNEPHVGDHVFMLEYDLVNGSDSPLTLVSVRVGHVPSGLREVGHRLYRLADGAEMTAWEPSSGPRDDPRRLDPVPVQGYVLPPHSPQPPKRMLMAEFEVLRPGTYTATDVVVRYRAKGHTYEQTLRWGFSIKNARP